MRRKYFNIDGSSGNQELEKHMADIFIEAFKLWKNKQKCYGSDNIAEQGITGIYGKLIDKKARFKEYLLKGSELSNETIEDTLLDIINYASIALAFKRKLWPAYSGENYKLVKSGCSSCGVELTLSNKRKPKKLLYIFDKDGTICQSKSSKTFINDVNDQELIPGTLEKIQSLKANGHKIAITSNQGGVAFGYMSYNMANQIMIHAKKLIEADYYFFCAHHPEATIKEFKEDCICRKPKSGMLLYAMLEFGIKRQDTIFIGNRPEDVEAAKNVNVVFIYADDFFGRREI